jgi:hypothetical protein
MVVCWVGMSVCSKGVDRFDSVLRGSIFIKIAKSFGDIPSLWSSVVDEKNEKEVFTIH